MNRSVYVPSPSGEQKKERRHCCLIYRLEGGVFCPSCPRLRAEHRKRTTCVKD
ncbi:MAG: (2Fe-2S)-binding protein [Symbiopectobacterium sp.]